jgi:hypothetical protein
VVAAEAELVVVVAQAALNPQPVFQFRRAFHTPSP